MCGNSICQDRRFLARWMPRLEAYFHYRNLDVSTLKELVRRWKPEVAEGLPKEGKHEALADIHESIEELKYYRKTVMTIWVRGSDLRHESLRGCSLDLDDALDLDRNAHRQRAHADRRARVLAALAEHLRRTDPSSR